MSNLTMNSTVKEMLNYIWIKYDLSKSQKEQTKICNQFAAINITKINQITRKSMVKIDLKMGLFICINRCIKDLE